MNAPPTQPAASAPVRLSRIVLTGFMGAGKSTVGRLLAVRLNWNFLDLDAAIESSTGLTIPAIFATHGEPHFRQLESEALAAALSRDHLVLALGGGAPETLANRLLLDQTPATATIFLDAPFAVLYDRCILQAQGRPNLVDRAAAEARFLTRQPLYRLLAHHTIDTSNLTTDQTVTALLTQLNDRK